MMQLNNRATEGERTGESFMRGDVEVWAERGTRTEASLGHLLKRFCHGQHLLDRSSAFGAQLAMDSA
jgi:hypothetical protein